MDSNSTMEKHVNAVCRAAYMHLYNINKVKAYFDRPSLNNSCMLLLQANWTTVMLYCWATHPHCFRSCRKFKTVLQEYWVDAANMIILHQFYTVYIGCPSVSVSSSKSQCWCSRPNTTTHLCTSKIWSYHICPAEIYDRKIKTSCVCPKQNPP
jgi:hypothetical protein